MNLNPIQKFHQNKPLRKQKFNQKPFGQKALKRKKLTQIYLLKDIFPKERK